MLGNLSIRKISYCLGIWFLGYFQPYYGLSQEIITADSAKKLAFRKSEQKKAFVLTKIIAESQAKAFAEIPDSILQLENSLKISLTSYREKIINTQDTIEKQILRGRQFNEQLRYIALVEDFERKYPKYYQLKYANDFLSVSTIQNQLTNSQALIEYSFGQKDLYVFVITKDAFEWKKVSIPSHFNQIVQDFLLQINKLDKNDFLLRAYELYELLILPIYTWVNTKKQWLIIPEGILNTIPFECLITQKSNSMQDALFLLYHHIITYHITANLAFSKLNFTSEKVAHQGDFLGFAPVFSKKLKNSHPIRFLPTDTLKSDFEPIPHSERELIQIDSLFKKNSQKSLIYVGREAAEDELKKEKLAYKFIHFSTHSVAYKKNTDFSYIAFSQPDSLAFFQKYLQDFPVEDGLLYSNEIFNLRVATELLVLSSCETGVGKILNGEGVMSLIRGFIYAGAKRVMYSLWDMADESTALLMIKFYQLVLEEKLDYASALQQAKIYMIRSHNPYPLFWAGLLLHSK